MLKEDNKILKYDYGEKSKKVPFIIYADLESLLEKVNTCHNNPKNSSITKINKHTPSGYSLFRHCLFDKTKNKLDYYRGKNCMKNNISLYLKKCATKIINYEKKEMIPLTKKEKKIHLDQKFVIYAKKGFSTDDGNKKYHKIRNHCHYTGKYKGAAHNIFSLRYKTPKEMPVVSHKGSTYDYHFIIKDLVEKFEGQFECLGENTEKYITITVPTKKELNQGISITYKIKFIDSFRFMSSSLSNLVDNLSERFNCDQCTECKSCPDYMMFKDDQLIFNCFECKKNYKK